MYYRNNMMKHNLGIVNMNKKFALFACLLGSLGLSGCISDSPYNEGTYNTQVNTPSPCDENYLDAECQSQFVNYTGVAADYRKYGERSPRDVRISQAAAGNNMTAVIPPSIEDEVVEYQGTVATVEQPVVGQPVVDAGTAPVVTAQETLPSQQPIEQFQAMQPSPQEQVENNNEDEEDDAVEDWIADEGQNLKALLLEWSDRAGWRLVWDTNRNYTLTAGAMFRGTFADVSSALIRAFARAKPAPVATFYKGNRVLVVETLEDENAY